MQPLSYIKMGNLLNFFKEKIPFSVSSIVLMVIGYFINRSTGTSVEGVIDGTQSFNAEQIWGQIPNLLLAGLAWLRGQEVGKSWITGFPVLGGILQAIPSVATGGLSTVIANLPSLIIGFISNKK